ncbi:MAG: Sec-independent protein translocase protein TatB [Steroidobacteraceae bacterium]
MTRAPGARARQRGFLDFSMPELGIIFVVALVVLGPKKLPPLVQQIGRWVGRARHMARQFREQLEQEVNSINAVKPVERHVPAEPPVVGPPEPDVTAANNSNHADLGSTAATGVVDTAAVEPVEPAGHDTHPEAQIYFALNGTEPAVVAQDPYTPQPLAADSVATAESSAAIEPGSPAVVPVADPSHPATVEVLFPHDHG